MQDGTFKGTAKGFHGPLTSEVSIKNNRITHVKVEGVKPYTVGAYAVPNMVRRIEEAGNTDVDVVTTASVTTAAIVNGVNKAVEVSNKNMTEKDAADPKIKPIKAINKPIYPKVSGKYLPANQVDFDDEYDVIIAGSGISGLSAAIEAKKHGNKVIVFEKTGMIGGTSNYAAGVIQGSGDKYQKKFTKYQHDTPELHAKELIQAGENRVNPQMIRELAADSSKNIEWLASLGIKWNQVYGHRPIPYENKDYFAQRIHSYEHGGGLGCGGPMMHAIKKEADRVGVKVVYDTPVVNLVTKSYEDKTVIGVITDHKGKRTAHRAIKGVVLATASIDHNKELAREFAPQQYRDIKNNALTNSKYDTGDGILMGLGIGAATEGLGGSMDADFVCLSGFGDFVPTLPLIYVNGNGLRYVNEDTTYGYLTRANYDQEKIWGQPTWQIFDEKLFQTKGSPWKNEEALAKERKQGKFFKADSIDELAKDINVPAENLHEQIDRWNNDAKVGKDSQFGRKDGVRPFSAPFYAYAHQDSNFGSIGGLKVTTNYEVLDQKDHKIAHLYAIGCNSGGWNANYYPSSGTALAEGMHSGRKVGRVLSGLVKEVGTSEEETDVTTSASESTDASSGASKN